MMHPHIMNLFVRVCRVLISSTMSMTDANRISMSRMFQATSLDRADKTWTTTYTII